MLVKLQFLRYNLIKYNLNHSCGEDSIINNEKTNETIVKISKTNNGLSNRFDNCEIKSFEMFFFNTSNA